MSIRTTVSLNPTVRATRSLLIELLEDRRLFDAAALPVQYAANGGLAETSVILPYQNSGPLPLSPTVTQPRAALSTVAAAGNVFQPLTSSELTAALNNAQLGDTIILKAGVTYTGSFVLPNKTTGSGWITIQSSNLASLPADGTRVGPANAVNMPRIQSPGGNASAIRTAAGAHHYKLVGIELVGPANNSALVALISLGAADSTQTTMASVPNNLVIDRCYMRPNTPTAHIRRAIALNSASTDIVNSYIEEIHQPGSDSQAIGGWNGPGPYNIINNRLEGASENIMFGGATATLPGVVPSDIVIRGNHIVKPLSWRGAGYNVKNLFELKAGRRVLVEGNVMENCWVDGQTGVAIVLKLGNWGTTPQNVTEDVTLRNNIIRHANGGVALQGRDYAEGSPDGLVRRLSFVNNVFDDINGKWGNSGTGGGTFFLYMTHGPKDVTFDHNTMFNGYTPIEVDSNNETYPITNFKYTNNIVAHNSYGVRSTSGIGNITLNKYFTDAGHAFTKNILMGGNPNLYTSRPGNYFPATWDAVGFVDRAGGNYRLAPASPYNDVGTEGKDLGANIDTLSTATAGAISGVWTIQPPQPPVASTVYLSDIPWSGTPINGWGPVEKDKSVGEQAAGDGRTLTLNGKTYTKGLGVHAKSEIVYDLGGKYTTFLSDVGIDDEKTTGSVVFQIYADGVKLYDSGTMTGSSATKSLAVNVTGKQQLKLVVTDGGNGIGSDHADWAGARLLTGSTTWLSDLNWVGTPVNGWGPVEKDKSVGEQAAGDGRTLTLNGKTYAKGLGVHANSTIIYNLGGTYSTFLSDIGIDDEKATGSVVFQVWLDNVKAYDSGTMTGSTATKSLSLNVAGKQQLKLVVTDAGNGIGSDHADWAGAQLIA